MEIAQQLGRILAVDVDHRVTVGLDEREAGEQDRVVPELPRERDDLDARVGRANRVDAFEAAVVAPVVHEDDPPIDRQALEYRAGALVERHDVPELVVERHDDRKRRHRAAARRTGACAWY